MTLIAKQDLFFSEIGQVRSGAKFNVPDRDARKLIQRGLAMATDYETTVQSYERAVVLPEAPQVSARGIFRNVPDLDAEPGALATVRDSVRAFSDLPKQGNSRSSGRTRRGQGGPK